jgi:hypothetical protein
MRNELEMLLDQLQADRQRPAPAPPLPEGCLGSAELSQAAAGQGTPQWLRRVNAHCAACAPCRNRLELFREFLHGDQPEEAPPEVAGLEAVGRSEFQPRVPASPEFAGFGELPGDFTSMALAGDPDRLVDDFRPLVPYLFLHMGLEEAQAGALAEPFLDFVRSRVAEVTPQKRFRHLLPEWTAEFTREQRVAIALPLTTEQWLDILRAAADEEAVSAVLWRQAPEEPAPMRELRRELQALKPRSPHVLREYRSRAEQAGDAAAARTRRLWAAAAEEHQVQRYCFLELTSAA